ncbi:MAG: hypothetical protein K8R52_02950 [Bacteroidales bacterium]|nr:hypothetical protein [Bacteroidales bacterium]
MTRSVPILLFIMIPLALFSQEPEYLEFLKAEARLQGLFTQLYSDSLSDEQPLHDSIRVEMTKAISMQGSMDFPWNRLDRIGVITSEDRRMRVFTWHVMDDFDHYHYFGFIQVDMKKGRTKLYELKDNGKPQRGIMKLDQTKAEWYGKLYYQVLTNHHKRKTYYTLLGMDFNNSRSTIKSVEVVAIQRNEPHFVRSRFFNGRDFVDRLVLEYANQVAISVRYDPGTEMITFDHLVPFHPIYKNNYEFYGPDGSFDGLEFSEGRWIYHDDIDARNID